MDKRAFCVYNYERMGNRKYKKGKVDVKRGLPQTIFRQNEQKPNLIYLKYLLFLCIFLSLNVVIYRAELYPFEYEELILL